MAIIMRLAEEDRPPVPGHALTEPGQSHADQLRHYARTLYTHMTRPCAVALKRIILAEALRDTEFAKALYTDLHLRAVGELSQVFSQWTAKGYAAIDNPQAAADLFIAMLVNDVQMRMICIGEQAPLTPSEVEWRLEPFIAYFKII